MWWGRKSVFVAVLLAGLILCSHLFGIGIGELWSDVARGFFFVVVALCVGTLSEKVLAGQQALRISEEKYRALIDKSLGGILVYRDDAILFANPRVGELLGYPDGDVIGKPIWDLIHPEDRREVRELVRKREAGGQPDLHYECRLIRYDGGIVWADVASSAVEFEEEPAVLVTAYDISDRKEAEEKRKQLAELAQRQEEQLVHSTRLAELGEMAAGIAHELNQPLTGIRNFARNALYMLDQDVGEADDVKNNLQLVSEQVDRASKIISQMRELTRRSEQEFAPVNVNSIVKESVEFLMPQLTLSGVEVTLDLADGIPDTMGDKIRLEQVLLNLLTNARQAMEEVSDRRLEVRTYCDDDTECPVVVEIEDTGKGFVSKEAEKLFTPFFSTKKPGHGTGLGLSISLSIVRGHKGRIEARGAPREGARFTVRLPVRRDGGDLGT
jgi:PAS domain S-box-containing protein